MKDLHGTIAQHHSRLNVDVVSSIPAQRKIYFSLFSLWYQDKTLHCTLMSQNDKIRSGAYIRFRLLINKYVKILEYTG